MFFYLKVRLSLFYMNSVIVSGFLSKNDFRISPLKTIVSVRAFSKTILEEIREEFSNDESMFEQLLNTSFDISFPQFYFFILALTFLYTLQLQKTMDSQTGNIQPRKWNQLMEYKKSGRLTRSVFIMFLIIFARNVENAI